MHKIIAVLVTALAVILSLLTFASPAQADQATARASFDSIADQAANKIQSLHPHTYSGVREEEAWNSAYAAELMAHRDGSWSDPDVTAYLNKVYQAAVRENPNDPNSKIIGYGKNKVFDAWDKPSANDINTIYTVTLADHVGEPLLAGYKAGVVPRARLQEIADALWDIPRYNTDTEIAAADGKCFAYSNSPYDQPAHTNANGAYWCAINVNIGAAAFLQKLQNEGIHPTAAGSTDTAREAAVDGVIQEVVDFTLWAEGEGASIVDEWPYAFRSYDGDPNATANVSPSNNPQDANHAAYTAESLTALTGYSHSTASYGTAVDNGTNALAQQINDGDHVFSEQGTVDPYNTVYSDPTENKGLIENKGFDIVGRQRAASVYTLADNKQLLAEAQWWVNAANAGSVEGASNPYSWGQIGRWAARLSTNATASAEQNRQVEFMSKPRVYNYPYSGSGSAASLTSVKKGSKYTIWADARIYDDRAASDLQFLTNIPIRLKLGLGNNTPSLFDTKNSGYEWYGSRFVYTVPSTTSATSVTFCSEVTADQAGGLSQPNAGCRVVTITN